MTAGSCLHLLLLLLLFSTVAAAAAAHEVRPPQVPSSDNVTKLYVLFSNHLDVGYTDNLNGSCAGAVVNRYFHEHFPQAIAVAEAMRSSARAANATKAGRRYRWMTQSWLVSVFRNCEASVINIEGRRNQPSDVVCPNRTAIAAFDAAARRGDITWSAFPFNAEPEMLSATMFDAGLNLTFEQDRLVGHAPRQTISVRDVPGLTRAAIPLMVKRGVHAVSVGENGACAPVNVPSSFVWRDPDSATEILALFHPGGYGEWPPPKSNPGTDGTGTGIGAGAGAAIDSDNDSDGGAASIRYDEATQTATVDPANDCAFVPHSGVAICYAWRGDNAGPARSTTEIDAIYDSLEATFPRATVVASDSFDDFVQDVQPFLRYLPVVEKEIGDTWIMGASSDPVKVALFRAASRARTACASNCSEAEEPNIRAFDRLLLKVSEHTWGWNGGNLRTPACNQQAPKSEACGGAVLPPTQRQQLSAAAGTCPERNHCLVRQWRRQQQQHQEEEVIDAQGSVHCQSNTTCMQTAFQRSNVSTAAECCQQCQALAKCKVWEYASAPSRKHAGNGNCHLKKDFGTIAPQQGTTCGSKLAFPSPGPPTGPVGDYSNKYLQHMLASNVEYQNGMKTWLEQRAFVRNAVAVLTAGRINSPLAAAIEREFALLKPVEFADVGFADAVSLKQVFRCGAMTVGFGDDGAISTLVDANGHAWADTEHTLGRLWYSGSDAADEERFTAAYIVKPTYKWKNYNKPGLKLKNLDGTPRLVRLRYRQQPAQSRTEFLLSLQFPKDVHEMRGAPTTAEVHVVVPNTAQSSGSEIPGAGAAVGGLGAKIDYTVQWWNKTACHAPETIWWSSNPRTEAAPAAAAAAAAAGSWKIDKMGSLVDPLSADLRETDRAQDGTRIGPNGANATCGLSGYGPSGQLGCGVHLHAVGEGGVTYTTHQRQRSINIASMDVALVSMGLPSPFPTPLVVPNMKNGGGVHFSMVSNTWNTNYPLWFPFSEGDENQRFRFSITLR